MTRPPVTLLTLAEVPEAEAGVAPPPPSPHDHWRGMPEFAVPEGQQAPRRLIVLCRTEEEWAALAERLGVRLTAKTRTVWWPPTPRATVNAEWVDGAGDAPAP